MFDVIDSIVILLNRCCLPNDEGPAPSPQIFFLEPPLLVLCIVQSLMELQRRRRTITEPECRYFIRQMALACAYLHRSHIIHRDLKLGNLFLNDSMDIKIGDFGLATKLDYDGERKLYASVLSAVCQISGVAYPWDKGAAPKSMTQKLYFFSKLSRMFLCMITLFYKIV